METRKLLTLCLLLLAGIQFSYAGGNDLIEYPVAGLKLAIEQDGGSNGSAVVYNPQKDYYHVVIAGNSQYPMETFGVNGARIGGNLTLVDIRGLWWNSKTKSLEGNCYNDGGIIRYKLSGSSTRAVDFVTVHGGGSHQPTVQAAGTIDAKGKELFFLNDNANVTIYDFKSGEEKEVVFLSIPVARSNISPYTVMSTGKKKMEFAVLDFNSKRVYLFDRKSGRVTGTVYLPSTAVVNDYFRVSYANDHVWLFDTEERSWTGYKIFE